MHWTTTLRGHRPNPPYSIHWDWDGNPLLNNDPRFPPGIQAPKSKATWRFIMHGCLRAQRYRGIVRFPGILSGAGPSGRSVATSWTHYWTR